MQLTELVLYHCLCLCMLLITFGGQKGKNRDFDLNLRVVYLTTGLLIVSDCMWSVLTYIGIRNAVILYLVNILYFFAEISGLYAWMRYLLKMLHSRLYENKLFLTLMSLPALFSLFLAVSAPANGMLFSLNGTEYTRGAWLQADTVIKLGYLVFSCLYALIRSMKETRKYLRKRDLLFILYGVPVIAAGILQVLFGFDLNCSAPVIGLAVVYRFGLANELKENSDLINAIGKAYSASVIINTDDRRVRVVATDDNYTELNTLAESFLYDECVSICVGRHVVPEDRDAVEQGFSMDNVLGNLEEKNAYSLVYKIISEPGKDVYNKATFMKAFGEDGRHDIFLGIERFDTRQVLLQHKVDRDEEEEMFEKVKEHFTDVIANVIEARDTDSGEHVMRVKSITQRLCNRMMEDYPEYGLTPRIIRYITTGSAMHDIGKIRIPDAILLKPGPLTKEEKEIMKTHTVRGCEILEKFPADLDEEYIRYAKEICRWHHEEYSGHGYPDGLAGDQIPVSAQIVSLADCFEALMAKRPYKPAYSREKALCMILNGECGVFNEKLLSCLKKIVQEDLENGV
ncbi:MAG: HD domain-containing protein [Clostridia bacterium]|nr:HD domain-containing protein [Clostridia bacterium]